MLKRVVLDTSVVVAGLRSRLGAANAVLRLVDARRLVVLATPTLFLEYEEVLMRAEHRLAHGLSPAEIAQFLAELAALIEPVDLHFRWRPQSTDSNDEMVIEAAVNASADALVTYNVDDFLEPCRRFGLPVLRPAEVLRR